MGVVIRFSIIYAGTVVKYYFVLLFIKEFNFRHAESLNYYSVGLFNQEMQRPSSQTDSRVPEDLALYTKKNKQDIFN